MDGMRERRSDDLPRDVPLKGQASNCPLAKFEAMTESSKAQAATMPQFPTSVAVLAAETSFNDRVSFAGVATSKPRAARLARCAARHSTVDKIKVFGRFGFAAIDLYI